MPHTHVSTVGGSALPPLSRPATWGMLFLCLTALLIGSAVAGTSGAEFSDLYTKLSGWMTGYLGRVIAAVFIIVGLVAGVTRGSIMGFVFGVSAGTGLFLAPAVIDATVSGTLTLI